MKNLWNMSMDNKYLWLDISMLFNCDENIYTVATYLQDGKIVCCFNWLFDENTDKKYFDRVVKLPYAEWWGELWARGCVDNAQILIAQRKNR